MSGEAPPRLRLLLFQRPRPPEGGAGMSLRRLARSQESLADDERAWLAGEHAAMWPDQRGGGGSFFRLPHPAWMVLVAAGMGYYGVSPPAGRGGGRRRAGGARGPSAGHGFDGSSGRLGPSFPGREDCES